MQILFACYHDRVTIFYTCPEADIGLHTDGIRAVILCAVRKFGFFSLCHILFSQPHKGATANRKAIRLPDTNEIRKHIWFNWGNNFSQNFKILHYKLRLIRYSNMLSIYCKRISLNMSKTYTSKLKDLLYMPSKMN